MRVGAGLAAGVGVGVLVGTGVLVGAGQEEAICCHTNLGAGAGVEVGAEIRLQAPSPSQNNPGLQDPSKPPQQNSFTLPQEGVGVGVAAEGTQH